MAFDIRFLETAKGVSSGEVVLDEFVEHFESPLDFWTPTDYETQWQRGVSRLFEGETKSALVTAMYPPEKANFIIWWVMYRESGMVVFRNHILLMRQLERPFDISRLYSFVPDRVSNVDAEFPISEWVLELDSLKSFVTER